MLFENSPILTITKTPRGKVLSMQNYQKPDEFLTRWFVREAILLTCFLLVMAISGSERKFGDVDRTHQQLNRRRDRRKDITWPDGIICNSIVHASYWKEFSNIDWNVFHQIFINNSKIIWLKKMYVCSTNYEIKYF